MSAVAIIEGFEKQIHKADTTRMKEKRQEALERELTLNRYMCAGCRRLLASGATCPECE